MTAYTIEWKSIKLAWDAEQTDSAVSFMCLYKWKWRGGYFNMVILKCPFSNVWKKWKLACFNSGETRKKISGVTNVRWHMTFPMSKTIGISLISVSLTFVWEGGVKSQSYNCRVRHMVGSGWKLVALFMLILHGLGIYWTPSSKTKKTFAHSPAKGHSSHVPTTELAICRAQPICPLERVRLSSLSSSPQEMMGMIIMSSESVFVSRCFDCLLHVTLSL